MPSSIEHCTFHVGIKFLLALAIRMGLMKETLYSVLENIEQV